MALRASLPDDAAFRALYARHFREVRSIVTRLVSASDRDDVIQDVFLQLFRALPSFRGDASLPTFLRRITLNVAFDHVRRRARHRRIEYDSDAVDAALDDARDPEQRSGARQQLAALVRRLDDLVADQRRALLLIASGASLATAAAQLGGNPSAIKQRVRRARRELMGKRR